MPSSHSDGPRGNGSGGGTVSRVVQDLIGEQLRVVYDDLRDEPAPIASSTCSSNWASRSRTRADDRAPDIKEDILRAVPRLRAFAISLTGNIDQADDLVQEAIVRGFEPSR